MTFFKNIENADGIGTVLFERKNLYKNLLPFAQDLLREPSYLDPGARELIAAYVSSLNNCKFCQGSHSIFANSIGVSLEVIEKVLNNDYEDMKFKPIFDFVKKLTLAPDTISQEDVTHVLDSGFKEEELQDAIAVASAFNMFNRIVSGHGIEENKDTWNKSAQRINDVGYDARHLALQIEKEESLKNDENQAPPVTIFMDNPMI